MSAGQEWAASVERLLAQHAEQKLRILSEGGELAQAEAIARHYVSVAKTAIDLLKILELSRGMNMVENTRSVVRFIVGRIKAAHAGDLGIELSWPESKGDVKECPTCGGAMWRMQIPSTTSGVHYVWMCRAPKCRQGHIVPEPISEKSSAE